jgi:hypothetical protein
VAGPIKISVITNAIKARRDLVSISQTVQKLGRVKTFVFDRTAFEAGYARPYSRAMHGVLADNDKTRAYFAKKAADYPPVGKAPKFTDDKDVSFRRALKNYKALGGEARVSLQQLNSRVARFETVATDAYGKATTKLQQYKDTTVGTIAKAKALALAAAAIGIASRGIGAAGGYLKKAVSDASDLNETTSKTGQIFKGATPTIVAFAKSADRNLGLSQQAALDAASGFGDMFTQIGFGQKQATKLSTGTLQLAADIASFSNLDVSDVTDRISGAYRGEYDALQKVVPNISAARVQTEALALSHKKSASALTAQDKALAVNAIVTTDTARSAGDFKRTSGGLANVLRTNKAGFENLSATIGTAFYPAVTAVAIVIRDKVLPFLNKLVTQYAPKANKFFTDLAKNGFNASTDLGQASAAIKVIGQSLVTAGAASGGGLTSTLTVASVAIKFLADNADLLAKAMPYVAAGFVTYKVAVLAANVAAAFAVPLKLAELILNYQLAKSNRALLASRIEETAATAAGTTTETASTVVKGRGVIATLASRAAALASAAATRVMTVSQAALNVVMSLNPIGLVVIAVLALVAAFVIAYKKSERFRAIVNAVFGALKSGVLNTIGFIRQNWPTILAVLTGPVGLAFLAFRRYKTKIVAVFTSIKNTVAGLFSGIGAGIVAAIKGMVNQIIQLANAPIRALNKVAGKVPGIGKISEIPALASGGIVRRPTLALVGEAGPEAVVPLNGRYGAGSTTIINVTVQAGIGNPVEMGRESVRAITAYERSLGRRVVSNAAA